MAIIRKFRPADASEVSNVIRKTLQISNLADYSKAQINFLCNYFKPTKINQLAKKRFVLVASVNNRIVATGSLEEDQLYTIFVSPLFQKQGIGKKLIKFLEKKAKINKIKALKLKSSLTGTKFYSKLGYESIKKLKSKIIGDQILMRKVI